MNCSVNVCRGAGRFACGIAVWAVVASVALAAPPKIVRLSVRGFQIGATTRINVVGSGLDVAPRLLLSTPIESQKVISKRADSVVFDVTLPADAVTGVEHLRIQTPAGVSLPELVAIDRLPQTIVVPADAKPPTLPVAVHGLLPGASTQETKFVGRRDEAVTIDLLARRFGSKLRPVVHLYDPQRRQLAWSLPQTALAGDVRLTAVLPEDGEYVVAVHDLTYAATPNAYYRLAIGSFDYADAVYPPTAARGTSPALELVGRFGAAVATKLDATSIAKTLAADDGGEDRLLAWPAKTAPVGLRPHVQVSDLTELTEEQLPADARKLTSLPIAVSGRLLTADETDVYQLDLAANEKIRIDVQADRYASPLDAVLELRDNKGARLAQNDDAVGPDPRLEYVAPNKPTPVTIAVSDALRRGDSTCIYRVVVTRIDDVSPRQDFRLVFGDETHNLPIDGTKLIRIVAERAGYDGPIVLTTDGLPKGFAAMPATIPTGADGALVEVRRTGTAASDALGRFTIRGESVGVKPALVRTAEVGTHPLGRLVPWLKYEAIVAAADVPSGPIVQWDEAAAKDATLYIGTDDKLTVDVLTDPQATGVVRLSLLTSQLPPPAEQQAAAAAASQIRGIAAAVDVKPTKPVKDKSPPPSAKKTEYPLRVPLDLHVGDYDLALKAEVLSADGKTTVAESYTPPRRFRIVPPFALKADELPSESIALDAKAGASLSLAGSIERFQGFAGDVTVTLVGLPAGVTVPSVVLKPKQDHFKLDFKLPPNLAVVKLDGVKIAASIPIGARANSPTLKVEVSVPSRAVTGAVIAIGDKAAPPAKPKADKPARKKKPVP